MNPNSMIQSQDVPYDIQDADEFRQLVMEEKWEEVIRKYEEHVFFHKIKIKGRGTALHVAVSNANEDIVKGLVDAIVKKHDDQSGLEIKTERGDTPLHLAAYRGFKSMCEYIIGKNGERKDLIQVKNAKGETPLFSAVLARHKKTFIYLHRFFPSDINIAINNVGATILHVAIHREMFGMANIIMYLYPIFRSMKDKHGVSPLEILATRTSAFESSKNQLPWWKKILYNCVSVKVTDPRTRIILYGVEDVADQDLIIPLYNIDELEKADKVQHTLARLDFSAKILCSYVQMFVFSIWHIVFSSPRKRWSSQSLLGEIKRVKKKHICGSQLLEAFMKDPYESYICGGANPFDYGKHDEEIKEKDDSFENFKRKQKDKDLKNKSKQERRNEGITSKEKASDKKGLLLVAMKELPAKKSGTNDTAYLRAAKHGITEIMLALESTLKSVIHETNSDNENALLIAVKYRQPQVVEGLWKRLSMETFQSINQQIDINENTILHLAAFPSIDNENSWKVSGAAMQMMWDIKWYKYIKGLEPEHFNHRSNNDGKTPSEIFKEERKELLQNSTQWLIETTQSCSAVAAIVAGISFATLSSVPGGNKETGKSSSEEHTALEGFAISSLIGVYFSVTALILFLSILIDRKQVEDFDRNLPLKLLIGLSSVFVSIVAVFVSFCTGHFLTLSDKYTMGGILFYLYVLICLPVTLYAIVQFRLYVDLVKILWKKVPPPSIKGVKL